MDEQAVMPWEMQPGETPKAFEAFVLYRDMPACGEKRSMNVVAKKLEKSGTVIHRWSSKYKWTERVKEYDRFLDRDDLDRRKKLIQETIERQLKISYSLERKALEALKLLNPSDMKAKEILDTLKLAMEIQSKILVEPQENGEDVEDRPEIVIYAPDNGLGKGLDEDE